MYCIKDRLLYSGYLRRIAVLCWPIGLGPVSIVSFHNRRTSMFKLTKCVNPSRCRSAYYCCS